MRRSHIVKVHPNSSKLGRPDGYIAWVEVREGVSYPAKGATVGDTLRAAAQIADNLIKEDE